MPGQIASCNYRARAEPLGLNYERVMQGVRMQEMQTRVDSALEVSYSMAAARMAERIDVDILSSLLDTDWLGEPAPCNDRVTICRPVRFREEEQL